MPEAAITLRSTITCPRCGHQATETMLTDACQYFYDRQGCGALLEPKAGDCCVYCSYGDKPCPPIQENGVKACRGAVSPTATYLRLGAGSPNPTVS
ncbi:MAG TPA: GDCCVxC domain-containing (seleno)protein [Caulobacteraceae bacterium]|nr:GDCCVxC domain-containing (seleno)protein [Caulobacteraceae bacterium]